MQRNPRGISRRQDCECEQVDSVGEQGRKLADAFNCTCKVDGRKSFFSRVRVNVG